MKKIYCSVLLKDNMIMGFRIGPEAHKMTSDFHEDFTHECYELKDCDNDFRVEWICIEFENVEMNECIFEVIARTFMKQWKVHPKHFGSAAY